MGVFAHVCTCVVVYLRRCVFVYLRICVCSGYWRIDVSVYLRNCVFVCRCIGVLMYSCICAFAYLCNRVLL